MSKLPEERKQPQSTSTDIVQIPSLPNEMLNEIVGWVSSSTTDKTLEDIRLTRIFADGDHSWGGDHLQKLMSDLPNSPSDSSTDAS